MANNSYKLLVIDVDGTLVGRDGNILAEDREALARVCDLGIKVSLSTGRAIQACFGIIGELGLDGSHIFFDGALVCDPHNGEEVYAQPINRVIVKQLVEFAHLNDISLDFYSKTHYFVERETWSSVAHRDFFGVPPTIVDFTMLWEQERIIKGGMVAISPPEVAKAEYFHREFGDNLYFSWVTTPSYPGVEFINVVAPGVTKGKALETLASHLGIALDEVIAIGDGNNDVSLLSSAGWGVAMGNATDRVKEVADYVTLDVEHGGVAAAIKKLLW